MRAFMSDRTSGWFAPPKDADWPTVAGHAAVTEARRILAETEPERNTAHLLLLDHRTGSVPLFTNALAEALAAFVAKEE